MTAPAQPDPAASRSRFWPRLIALTRKESRQLLRDPSSLAIGILLPIVLILIFGFGLSLDVKNAPIAVVLEDTSPTAVQAVSGLQLTPYISPVMLTSMREAEALMHQRKVDGIVRVPGDFSRRLAAGDASIQLIVHGAEASKAAIVLSYASAALAQNGLRLADRGGASAPPGIGSVTIEQRMWFNAANT
ncbi:MAG TPA: ABC transporter permease, partial [Variovorax sp.]